MSSDLFTQLRDYGRYHEDRQPPVGATDSALDDNVDLITIEKGQTTDMKPRHWGMFLAAAIVVTAVLVTGGVVIANNVDDDDSGLATEPPSEGEVAGFWEYTDRPVADGPMDQVRMEFHEDGTYAAIAWPDVRADYGRYEFTDGELTLRTDGGRGCVKDGFNLQDIEENATGRYRLTYTTPDSVIFAVIADECSAREKVLDGAQIARLADE